MRKHLYVIDDEEGVRAALGRELREWAREAGLAIKVYENPLEALDNLGKAAASAWIVISDQRMPQLDGLSFMRAVNDSYPWIPQILLTGVMDVESIVAANPPGLFSVLEKPWDHETLLRMVERAMAFREARAQAAAG